MTSIFTAFALAGLCCGLAQGMAQARPGHMPADAAAYQAIAPFAPRSATPVSPGSAPPADDRSTITGGPAGGLATGN